jgi:hypothetical protein
MIAADKYDIPVLSKVCEAFLCPKELISFNATASLFLFPKMTTCLMELEWTCNTSCKTRLGRKECTVHHEQSEASELLHLCLTLINQIYLVVFILQNLPSHWQSL